MMLGSLLASLAPWREFPVSARCIHVRRNEAEFLPALAHETGETSSHSHGPPFMKSASKQIALPNSPVQAVQQTLCCFSNGWPNTLPILLLNPVRGAQISKSCSSPARPLTGRRKAGFASVWPPSWQRFHDPWNSLKVSCFRYSRPSFAPRLACVAPPCGWAPWRT